MTNIEHIAALLLIERVIAVIFMFMVLYKQINLLGKPINFDLVPKITKIGKQNVYRIRRILFFLSLTIFLGNMVPIIIDGVTLFIETSRPNTLSSLSISYAISNATTDMLSGLMIWLLYKLAVLSTDDRE